MTKNLIIQENLSDDVSKNKLNILYNLPTETKIEIMRKRAVIKKDKKYTDEESLNYIDTINDIIKQFLEHEKVHVIYKFSKACKDHGRLYANTGISKLPADFRNYLIKDKFHDIDIVNAVPSILKYLNDTIIKSNCPYLDKYIKNRDKTLKKYNLSKYDVIGWIFKSWEYKGDNKFLQCFNNEILNIQNKVFDNENFKNVTKNQLKKENKKGGFLSRVLFYYENVILNDAIDKLKIKKILANTLIFDGFIIEDKHNITDVLKIVNDNKYGIKFISKPPNTIIDEYINDPSFVPPPPYESSEDLVKKNFEKQFFITKNPVKYFSEFDSLGNKQIVEHSLQSFKTLTACYKYEIVNEKGKNKMIKYFDKWLEDPDRRAYDKIDFYPTPSKCPKHIYNSFEGWNSEVIEKKENIENFLELINNLCDHNEKVFEYVLNYIAHMVQLPHINPEIALVFKGMKGTGKDLLFYFIKQMLGDEYTYDTCDVSTITGKYNGVCSHKLFILLNELSGNDGFANDKDLKSLITQQEKNLALKNVNQWREKNYMRLMIASNNDNVINITQDNRRFCVIKTGKKKERAFYGELRKQLKNKKYINSIYTYFMEKQIDNFDTSSFPETEELKEMKSMNTNPIYKFIYDLFVLDMLQDYNINYDDETIFKKDKNSDHLYCKNADFCEIFKQYLENESYSLKYIENYSYQKIKRSLGQIDIFTKQRKRNNKNYKYYLFSKKHFLPLLKFKYDGEEEEESINDIEFEEVAPSKNTNKKYKFSTSALD